MEKTKKIWGHEKCLMNNDLYCGKILFVKKGHRCSIHYHKIKDETFYILSGELRLELLGETIILKKGDQYRLYPNTMHRFSGVKDTKILEISTHHEDSDSHRLLYGGKIGAK